MHIKPLPAIAFIYWFMLAGIYFIGYVVPVGGNIVVVSIPLVGLLLYLVCYPSQLAKVASLRVPSPLIPCILFVLWAAISSQWAPEFEWRDLVTLGMSILPLVILFMLYKMRPGEDIFNASMWGLIGGCLMLGLGDLALAPTSLSSRANIFHPNPVANQMLMGLLSTFYQLLRASTRQQKILMTCLCLFFFMITVLVFSKTALIAGIVCVLLWVFLLPLYPKTKTKIYSAITVMVLIGLCVVGGNLANYEDAATLTGRTGIWEYAIERFLQNPLIGNGFHSFAYLTKTEFLFPLSEVHNDWLNTLYHFGLIGVALHLATYLTALGYILKCLKVKNNPRLQAFSQYALVLFLYFMIRGLTEADDSLMLFGPSYIFLLVFAMRHFSREPAELHEASAQKKRQPVTSALRSPRLVEG